jgi:hypothetical protein
MLSMWCRVVPKNFRSKIRSINFSRARIIFAACGLIAVNEKRLLVVVHGRKFYLAPPRRPGGPYYIRFEPPSNQRTRIRVVHRSLRTNVIAAEKARAKLIIEPRR